MPENGFQYTFEARWIKIGQPVIDDQQIRTLEQGAGNGKLLALSSIETPTTRPDRVLQSNADDVSAHVELIKLLGQLLAHAFRPIGNAMYSPSEKNILLDRHGLVEIVLIKDIDQCIGLTAKALMQAASSGQDAIAKIRRQQSQSVLWFDIIKSNPNKISREIGIQIVRHTGIKLREQAAQVLDLS